MPEASVTAVGESALAAARTRPDYAITLSNVLVGFVELKAPGKGADPRRFKDRHDKDQWTRLQLLPNLVYTDGNAFSLWRDGNWPTRLCVSSAMWRPREQSSALQTRGSRCDVTAAMLRIENIADLDTAKRVAQLLEKENKQLHACTR